MPMPFGKRDNRHPEAVVLAKGSNALQNNHLPTGGAFQGNHPFAFVFPRFGDASNYVAVAGMIYSLHLEQSPAKMKLITSRYFVASKVGAHHCSPSLC